MGSETAGKERIIGKVQMRRKKKYNGPASGYVVLYNTLWIEKNTPKCFCHIFYKTQSILIKFGVYYPEYICHTEM